MIWYEQHQDGLAESGIKSVFFWKICYGPVRTRREFSVFGNFIWKGVQRTAEMEIINTMWSGFFTGVAQAAALAIWDDCNVLQPPISAQYSVLLLT